MKVVKWLCRCTSFISPLELKLNFWIPYSNCQRDSAFLEQNLGCRSPGFLIPQAKISHIRESRLPSKGRSIVKVRFARYRH